jgi:hypothetical protein
MSQREWLYPDEYRDRVRMMSELAEGLSVRHVEDQWRVALWGETVSEHQSLDDALSAASDQLLGDPAPGLPDCCEWVCRGSVWAVDVQRFRSDMASARGKARRR